MGGLLAFLFLTPVVCVTWVAAYFIVRALLAVAADQAARARGADEREKARADHLRSHGY